MRLFVILATTAMLVGCTDQGANNMSDNDMEMADVTADDVAEEPMPDDDSSPSEPDDDNAASPPPGNGTDDDDDEADQCGASRYQYLVGQPRSRIPAKPAGATWRVTCTGCPITMDYSPARMNIFYDEESEIVETVRCG